MVVTGQVQDSAEAGVESNGAGKSALVMAPLWALTGSTDARAEVCGWASGPAVGHWVGGPMGGCGGSGSGDGV